MTLTAKTTLLFTVTKNGHAIGRVFKNTVQGYIDAISLCSLMEIQNNLDAECVFYDLPLEEQLERCVDVNGEMYASRTTWTIVND